VVQVEEEKIDNIISATKTVLKKSQANNGLVKGLAEVVKALDRKEALLCVLAEDCEDAKYKKLVTSLCKANNIPLLEVEKRADIGEWLNQCKYDKTGVARRVRGCSSAAIKDYGEETEALNFVQNYIKENVQ
jgi:small subunit ribosomal protein S12e